MRDAFCLLAIGYFSPTSWAGLRRDRKEEEGETQKDMRSSSHPWTDFCSALAAVKPGPSMAALLHSRSGHVLSKVWMTSTSTCVECFRPRPGCSLANASLTARRARHGYGWWDARSSLPLEKQVKRHAFLKVVRIPLNPECFTALRDTKETRSNICWGHFSCVLNPPTTLRQMALYPFYRRGNWGYVLDKGYLRSWLPDLK